MNMGQCNCGTQASAHDRTSVQKLSVIQEYLRPLISLVMMLIGSGTNLLDVSLFQNKYVSLVWYILACIPVGLPVIIETWKSIRQKDYFSEFTLMSVATMGAFYIGEYPEGVAVMLFYTVGEIFQGKAVDKAKRNIGALLDTRPETTRVLRNDELVTISPKAVKVNEIIEVKTGERVPLDGILIDNFAAFNTSALTGESLPRNIREGEEVLAGMIVTDKVIRIRVNKPFDKSALARILELVQDATERKAPAELFIRKFARIYTPIVIGLAILTVLLPYLYSLTNPEFGFIFNDWLYRSLVFLVISCPCALVISIPLGYFGGIGAASRLGILFKGGNYLDAITKTNTVVFDKTGTLTKGTFSVQSSYSIDTMPLVDLIRYIASIEKNSTHPIGKAIVEYSIKQDIGLVTASNVQEIAGHGLVAEINGKRVLVGNAKLLSKFEVEYPQKINETEETIVVCAVDAVYVGYLLLSDELKTDAKQTIEELKLLGIDHIQILSGDKQSIVSKFAKQLGISKYYGDLLPEGKVRHIEELKRDNANQITFVGDGMNDAPVLALSNIGIAMGGLGSDAAIETADIVIQTDQPSKVATAIRIGRITHRIVWQNISLAFGVKVIVMILGAGGIATLWEAVFADVGVALIAIANAIRIQKMIK